MKLFITIITWAILILITCYILVGFFWVPQYTKDQFPTIIGKYINKTASVEKVKFNPLNLEFHLINVSLYNKDKSIFSSAESINVDIAVRSSLYNRKIIVKDISANELNIDIQRDSSGNLNFKKLQKSKTSTPIKSKKQSIDFSHYRLFPDVIIQNISFNNSQIIWTDHYDNNTQKLIIEDINLSSKDFHIKEKLNFDLEFYLNGSKVTFNGQLFPAGLLTANIDLRNIRLSIINQYLSDETLYGTINSNGYLQLNFLNNFWLNYNGKIKLDDIPVAIINKIANKKGLGSGFSGKINANGKISVNVIKDSPPVGNFNGTISINKFKLAALNTILNKSTNLKIHGFFNAQSKVDISYRDKLEIKASANSVTNNFTSQLNKKDFLSMDKLIVDNATYDSNTTCIGVKKIFIKYPNIIIATNKRKQLNVSSIIKKSLPKVSSKTSPKSSPGSHLEQKEVCYSLDTLLLENGYLDYTDLSLTNSFKGIFSGINARVENIRTGEKEKINIHLYGDLYGIAPLDIKGKLQKNLKYVKVKISLADLPLPLISPYSIENVKYALDKGKISAYLDYKVINTRLVGKNKLIIQDIKLGEKHDIKGAKDLALPTAITVLKDKNGTILLEFPVSKTSRRLKFHTDKLITDALYGFIGKVASSPFNFLTGMFADKYGDIEKVTKWRFASGSDKLGDTKHMDKIIRMMKDKQSLVVEITGLAFTNHDWQYLKNDALLFELNKDRLNNPIKENSEEYNDQLSLAFYKRFPKQVNKGIFGDYSLIDSNEDFLTVAKREVLKDIKDNNPLLLHLAHKRAKSIASYFINKGINPKRIFLVGAKLMHKGRLPYSKITLVIN